jgi:hypothetical protein
VVGTLRPRAVLSVVLQLPLPATPAVTPTGFTSLRLGISLSLCRAGRLGGSGDCSRASSRVATYGANEVRQSVRGPSPREGCRPTTREWSNLETRSTPSSAARTRVRLMTLSRSLHPTTRRDGVGAGYLHMKFARGILLVLLALTCLMQGIEGPASIVNPAGMMAGLTPTMAPGDEPLSLVTQCRHDRHSRGAARGDVARREGQRRELG